jgi:hypothetical protein
MPLEVALRDWLAELRLSKRSQTTIDWYRDLFQGRILPALTRQGLLIRRGAIAERAALGPGILPFRAYTFVSLSHY